MTKFTATLNFTTYPKELSNAMNLSGKQNEYLFEYLLRLGDDKLILGHRLSEWCGHAPILEEDIALANIALDNIGQASALLTLAADTENKGRSEDDLAFHRDAREFRNLQLLEQPNTDFAYTIARQFFFDTYNLFLYEELAKCKHEELAGIAAKALKEIKYHNRHSREWILRLGDGTDESNARLQNAVNYLWRYTDEFFKKDEIENELIDLEIAPDLDAIKPKWKETVSEILAKANIKEPEEEPFLFDGGRQGFHTEHLGHLLAEMQVLPRTHPGAKW